MTGTSELLRVPRFAAGLTTHGDRVALIGADGEHVTYAELAARADRAAAVLPPGRALVALEASNTVGFVADYLGALRAGHAVILLAGLDTPAARRIVETYRPWTHGGTAPDVALDPALAVLLSTSGTTGSPKLVRLSAANVDANAASIAEYLAIAADDRAITSLPCHYSYGLSVLNSHLLAGAGIILTDASVSTPEFRDAFESHGATSLAGVPYTYELLESSGFRERAHPQLRTLTQAGGRLPPALVTTYAEWAAANGVRFFVMYGQTEATARMAYLPPERTLDASDCIGVAIPGGRFDLVELDDPAKPVTAGAGELVYTGPNVMMGYAEAPADLALPAGPPTLHTGDIAERRDDGLFRIVGRRSRFAKPFGLRIGLDDVEKLLRADGIEAAVTGNDALIAVAFTGDRRAAGIAATLAAAFKLPASLFDVTPVPALPRLPTGKVDYRTILDTATARRDAAAPGDDASFQQLYRDLLGRPEAGPDDSFVDLGGDSLSYVTVAMAIDKRLGRLPDDWPELSIAALDTLALDAPGRSKWFKPFDSEMILRGLAIIGVVLNHASHWVVGGGADALLMLAGFSLARFNFTRLTSGSGLAVVATFIRRVVIPYYAILLLYALFWKPVGIESFLLISNFVGRFNVALSPYWFIEALLQCLAITTLLFTVSAIRRAARARPFGFFTALFVAAVVVRIVAFQLFHHRALLNFTPDSVYPLFALGGMMYFARSGATKALCLACATGLALATSDVFGGNIVIGGWPFEIGIYRARWVAAAALVLLFVPRIWLPRPLGAALTAIAAISFTIYLTHELPVNIMTYRLQQDPLPTVATALAFGFLVHWCFKGLRQLPPVRHLAGRLSGR